eukprot:1156410-Pelagomonas_calceolata.AAC.8
MIACHVTRQQQRRLLCPAGQQCLHRVAFSALQQSVSMCCEVSSALHSSSAYMTRQQCPCHGVSMCPCHKAAVSSVAEMCVPHVSSVCTTCQQWPCSVLCPPKTRDALSVLGTYFCHICCLVAMPIKELRVMFEERGLRFPTGVEKGELASTLKEKAGNVALPLSVLVAEKGIFKAKVGSTN